MRVLIMRSRQTHTSDVRANSPLGGTISPEIATEKAPLKLTKCPHKVVFGPQSQHGQVKVDDLKIEGRGTDKVVVNGALHGEELAQRQIHKERDGTGGQLGDDRVLSRSERNITLD